MKKSKVILLGAPGSGKGTQAKALVSKYGYQHLATGDILRQEVAKQTVLGRQAKDYMDKGQLVPDDLVNRMVYSCLDKLGNKP
ncbi:MAG: nucleoside monophosphate kinase, partial [Candidatus Margulisiibacteriota bacterium]